MGCDIHPVVQVNENGWWHSVGLPMRMRDYSFFAKLAGVRTYHDGPALAEGRGIPEDFGSWESERWLMNAEDGHSDSWCTLAEMLHWPHAPTGDEHGAHTWRAWIDLGRLLMEQYEVTADNVRFVFNFDN